MLKLKNLATQKVNRLVVLYPIGQDKHWYWQWVTVCECGTVRVVSGNSLSRHHTQSCGCLKSDLARARLLRHGKRETPEYRAWKKMIERCTRVGGKDWKNYGGRGIAVCAEWRRDFLAFFNHVGPRPSAAYSIDRYPNNDGHYEPGNVRWATRTQQNNNQRRSSSHPRVPLKERPTTRR